MIGKDFVVAPWTDEQVTNLNRFQRSRQVHPFTCGNRDKPGHEKIDPEGDYGVLVATTGGWICRHCDFVQVWAHWWMAEPLDDADIFPVRQ